MSIKTVVTLLDTSGEQVASRVAVEVSKRNAAYLIGVAAHYESAYYTLPDGPLTADMEARLEEHTSASVDAAVNGFMTHFRNSGVSGETRVCGITLGGTFEDLRHLARLSDLMVLRQEDPNKPEPMRTSIIEAMVYDSGVTTLLVPHDYAKPFDPKNIVVAWDGSGPASHAVHASLPMLEAADKVTVVMIAGSHKPKEAELKDIRCYFERHKIAAHLDLIQDTHGSLADVLLEKVEQTGADMLVMGGYTHNRLSQYLFGGATRGILHRMTLPTLMTH